MGSASPCADFLVEKSVCATLDPRQPDEDPEKSCVLDMLVTAAHAPHLSAEERRSLYRLADLLDVAWNHTWQSSEARVAAADDLYEIRCYVPPSSEDIWEGMLAQAELNARMCGIAATSLRYLYSKLPETADMDRTLAWIDVAQRCLSTTGQKLRALQRPPSEAEVA